jgi:hypothetical protein
MKFTKSKDLLILLIGLFILQACKKEGDIGLEKQIDEEGLYGTLVDTHSIRLFSVKDDSLISSNYVRNQLGDFQDPLFGRTTASIAFQATLPKNNVDFGTGLVLDSIVLVMAYPATKTDRFYGDSSSRFELKLHQLDEDISNDSVYYSNRVFKIKSNVIGTLNYQAKPDDSITVQNIRAGKADTIAKIYPHLRMRLNDAFGQELLSKSGQTDLSSSSAFLASYKGFYFTATRLSGDGGIMSYDLTNTNRSYIVLYYRTSTDTTNFVFNVNSSSANINNYTHDYTGTEIVNQLADSNLGNSKVFIQSLAGLRGKMQFPSIAHLLDSGAIAINKAELVFKPLSGTESPYAPISTIAVKGRYDDNKEVLLNSGVYSSSKNEYRVDLTRSIQFIIDKKLKLKELYIEDNSKQINPKRTLISGVNSASPIKLRIFYTKLY